MQALCSCTNQHMLSSSSTPVQHLVKPVKITLACADSNSRSCACQAELHDHTHTKHLAPTASVASLIDACCPLMLGPRPETKRMTFCEPMHARGSLEVVRTCGPMQQAFAGPARRKCRFLHPGSGLVLAAPLCTALPLHCAASPVRLEAS